jgi:redox-sensitive bicupin YhaK (pirin superfamily)
MITLRKSQERGQAQMDWLDSKHTFSFGHYYDPSHMGFGPLRVINEDKVKPGAGFGTHAHDNMEIVSYVLEGALEHKDSMGNGEIIRPGDIQRMSAGSGISHSEYNHSKTDPVHFLQIWFLPEKRDVTPSYEQKRISDEDKRGRLKLVMSRDGIDDSVKINQDVNMYVGLLNEPSYDFKTSPGRLQWVQIARGEVSVNGHHLTAGDGAAIHSQGGLSFKDAKNAEVIVFDMTP